jgi:hypothetical protein
LAQVIGHTLPVIVTQKAIAIGVIGGKGLGELGQKIVLSDARYLYFGAFAFNQQRLYGGECGLVWLC